MVVFSALITADMLLVLPFYLMVNEAFDKTARLQLMLFFPIKATVRVLDEMN
ncbi:MAG: hypothetical protein ACWGOX_08190 [Desulforhopalus sp.]